MPWWLFVALQPFYLSWKQHIDNIVSKLNKACFAVRLVKPYMTTEILKTLYFSYFHSVLSYGIIFWGNLVCSQHIFKIQKRMIRIISNLGVTDCCRCAFKELGILPLNLQYLYSLLMFVAKNRDLFQANTSFHSVNTRYKNDLHLPSAHLKIFQKGSSFFRSKGLQSLTTKMKELSHDIKRFKPALRTFFQVNSFYSIEEYFNYDS